MVRKARKRSEFLEPAPPGFKWPRCPEADHHVEEALHEFLDQHGFARRLAGRMKTETSTLFSAWTDHLLLPARRVKPEEFKKLGFCEDRKARRSAGLRVFYHPFADLPKILISSRREKIGCAIAVDDLWRFQAAHRLSLPIQGTPCSAYRAITLPEGGAEFYVVERRGAQNFIPDPIGRAEEYLYCFEQWATRPREFEDEVQGMKATLALAQRIVQALGAGAAASLFLEGERIYWQKRNRAAQIQKARQDELGLGWANHDHHTFRSSRRHFPKLIEILLAFGFKKRERYYAGQEAGWGAQVMEQPEAGLIIFADVDLAPEDVTVDFSEVALPDLQKPGTVGLWCALHGESMLQAGMHHLEAKFDFDLLKQDLQKNQIETMPPFSDFSFLRQAFTRAEMWPVSPARLQALRAGGRISEDAALKIQAHGAVGSHLENLQRREGYKGFNQRGVSAIISAVNPEKLALAKPSETGAA